MALSRDARFAVGFASGGHFLCHGAMILLPLLQADVAAEFAGGDKVTVSFASTLYLVAMGLMAVPAGLLADRIGTARVLLLYFGAMTGAALLCAFSGSLAAFMVSHALLGGAAGLYHPPGLGLISLSSSRDEMGPALGLHGVIGNLGVATSPLLVMSVVPEFGWRAAFLALALTAALAGLAGFWLIRRGLVMPGRPADERADHGGLRRHGLALLLVVMSVNGFLLGGFTWQLPETVRNHGALIWDVMLVNTAILGLGAVGQYVGGMMARGPGQRGRYLILLSLQPLAFGATALMLDMPTLALLQLSAFALVNYMSQPVENRILAGFTSTARRSGAFALKFMVALIIGAPAPWIVARIVRQSGEAASYGFLCAVATLGLVAGVLFVRSLRVAAVADTDR